MMSATTRTNIIACLRSHVPLACCIVYTACIFICCYVWCFVMLFHLSLYRTALIFGRSLFRKFHEFGIVREVNSAKIWAPAIWALGNTRPRILSTNSFKTAIRENLDPRNINAIRYIWSDFVTSSLCLGALKKKGSNWITFLIVSRLLPLSDVNVTTVLLWVQMQCVCVVNRLKIVYKG